jgi:hypothetical protein
MVALSVGCMSCLYICLYAKIEVLQKYHHLWVVHMPCQDNTSLSKRVVCVKVYTSEQSLCAYLLAESLAAGCGVCQLF